ncbi:MAG TPA: ubiquinol-cytochrome C chaperone family protein [Caulobacteraceae bacterium]|jgi:cytochrome b pre-mRNA-processing protein 3|nr:ubiquinol-cytochrome C chaperone family protein [Caulobacteraceae bacterium]
MFLQRLLKPGPARGTGEKLYAATVRQARTPALYAEMGAPDTPDGRFEVYTLHVLLVLNRLRQTGQDAAAVSQAYFDAYIGGLDNGLRELAVGDLSVGKTMRRLGEAFYGRGRSLDAALAALPDQGPLNDFIARTVYGRDSEADPARLAAYVLAVRTALEATAPAALLAGDIDWPALG